jgi:predicted nucleic acid-binding protein
VSNASPLVNLARIGHLEFLHDLFGKLLVYRFQNGFTAPHLFQDGLR